MVFSNSVIPNIQGPLLRKCCSLGLLGYLTQDIVRLWYLILGLEGVFLPDPTWIVIHITIYKVLHLSMSCRTGGVYKWERSFLVCVTIGNNL